MSLGSAFQHSAVAMGARKYHLQWTCRAPARDAEKSIFYQSRQPEKLIIIIVRLLKVPESKGRLSFFYLLRAEREIMPCLFI